MNVKDQMITDKYALYNGDSAEVLLEIPENSIHYQIYSPPFSSLYTYSNSERDLGNCKSNDEFFAQFEYIGTELYRTLMPGRIMSVHCMDIPAMKERNGYIGLIDFPGMLIAMFERIGFIYHSRAVIWKDPLVEATRTKAIGLMHKQLVKDSAMCRNGLPDYIVSFRKPGKNDEPIAHTEGLTTFIGEDEPVAAAKTPTLKDSRVHRHLSMSRTDPVYSHHVWRRYASPVWMDINQSNTLNRTGAREENDERHICPLQIDAIARCLTLWSNPGDTVLSPFMGIGSEIYQALRMGRKGVGVELKESYYQQAVLNCSMAIEQTEQIMLFDYDEWQTSGT